MSFYSDLKYLITSDPSINTLTGGIAFKNLPKGTDYTKTWLVYDFKETNSIDGLDGRPILAEYNINVKVLSADSSVTETLKDYVINFLRNNEYGGIKDINTVSSNPGVDMNYERNIYHTEITFNAVFA